MTHSRYLGFLNVAAFFLILTLIWVAAKNTLMAMIRKAAYATLKKNQEKKAEEKSEAVRELMAQTTATLQEQGLQLRQNRCKNIFVVDY